MLTDALRQAAEALDRETADPELGVPQFGDARYTAVPFDLANFTDLEPKGQGAAIGFVDGGNMEILHAPDFSVQLVRVCSVVFRKGERSCARSVPSKIEFLSIARAFPRDGEIFYAARLIPASGTAAAFLPDAASLVISSRDDQLSSGRFRVDISVVGAAARRFAEWNALSGLVERELDGGDIAVRDGTLQTAVRNESGPASKAFSAALDKGVVLTALAKTSTLFTSSGISLLAAVEKLSRDGGRTGCWYYHPLVRNEHPEHRAEIFACRLHPASKHVFRFEVLREQARQMGPAELGRVFGELAANSRDLAFPGYPYGLVDADDLARVRRHEKEALKALLASALAEKGSWERVRSHLSAVDAHDILDQI
jgi:hypothetical protein